MRAFRTTFLLTLYSLFAGGMIISYFISYPIPGFIARVWEILLAILLLSMSAGTGRAIIRWTRLDGLTGMAQEGKALELCLWSVGMGMIPLSLGLLFTGVMGYFSPQRIVLFTVLWAAVGAKEWRPVLARLTQGAPSNSFDVGLGWGIRALVVSSLLIGLLVALAPPTNYDSLVYHLALPLRYLQEGKIGFIPYNQYAHFPQNMELIFGWFLAAGSDISAHLFNLILAGLTGVLLWEMGGRGSGRRWAILLYVTAPCVLLLSTETYVEMPLAFFTTLALWGANRGLKDRNRSWFFLSGLAGGFAAGIKYTGVITPFLLTMLILFWKGRRSVGERILDGACLGGTAFLLFLPWMVKNYFMTGGNPVFPFLPSIFPAENVYLFAESSRAYFEVLAEYKGKSSLLVELIQMPMRLITNAQSFGGGYDVTGVLGWALPLILGPLAFLTLRKGRGFLLAYAVAHVAIWSSLRPVLRFLFPLFPLVCLLVGQGFGEFWDRIPVWSRRLAGFLGGLFLISNGILFYVIEKVRDPLPVSFGLISRTEYLSKKLDYFPAMNFMKNELPEDANVLIVGDQRAYYCPRRHLALMGLLPTPLRDWTHEAADGEAFGHKLRKLGFTHLFFNFKEAKRIEGYRVLDLTDHGREVFQSFLQSLSPIHSTEGTVLFAIPS